MSSTLKMTTTFEAKEDHLVLVYEVANRDKRDVYLLNRLFRSVPAWEVSANIVYIHFLPESQTVWLSKKLADIPVGVQITAPVAPFVTPLRAGSTFSEEVVIPFPVREYRQYGGELQAAPEEPLLQTYKQVSFTLGYYWQPEDTEEEVREIQDTPLVIPKVPVGQPIEFGSLDSDVFKMDVPVTLVGGEDSAPQVTLGGP